MATGSTLSGSRPEIRGLQYWMERVLKELDAVRESPDPDAVHDLRVAIRRCRSVAAVMEEVDSDPSWRDMRKLARKLFRQLGELRDTQVLEDWTKNLGPESDAVRERLLSSFLAQEKELQVSALKAVDKFDQKAWKKFERKLHHRSRLVPCDGLAAECLALERLDAAKELHARAMRAEKPEAWHELRIGVKRFRYTVESLLPARYAQWGDQLKRVQDLLGEVHDLDVLAAKIGEIAPELTEACMAWAERITTQRHERIETYRSLAIGERGVWQVWRSELPQAARMAAAAQARLRATAKSLEAHTPRILLISRLSMRLFDGLGRWHADPHLPNKDLRRIVLAAGRLHGIGAGLDAKSPQKAARKYLRSLSLPPGWNEAEWDVMAAVVRYHRGALPDTNSKSFGRFQPEEQKTITLLAGVLRLARALSKCGVLTTKGFAVEKSVEALIVRVPGLVESEQNAATLAAGKYLLESSLGQPLIVKSCPVPGKVLELPKKEEAPPAAAASD